MKRALPLLIAVLFAGAAAFAVTQWLSRSRGTDEDTWLRQEFSLNDAQIAAIRKIRADYAPVCAHHCGNIAEARQRLVSAEKYDGPSSPAYREAREAFDRISRECSQATRAHVEAIAAQMPPEQARRYLEMVGPKITSAETAPIFPR